MALTKEEIEDIQKQAIVIEQINIAEWFTMIRDKALAWKARLS